MTVFKEERVKPHLKGVGTYKCRAVIISLTWLNENTIMAIDTEERVRVICVRTQTLVEVVDLSKVKLCYNSKFSQVCSPVHVVLSPLLTMCPDPLSQRWPEGLRPECLYLEGSRLSPRP